MQLLLPSPLSGQKRWTTLSAHAVSPPLYRCGLRDCIILQECPLVFQSLHHLHLSTLQAFSFPTKTLCLENAPLCQPEGVVFQVAGGLVPQNISRLPAELGL